PRVYPLSLHDALPISDQEPLVHRTVRGLVRGNPIYFVPRDDGEIVVGATQEEHGHDTALTVGGLWHILRDARELVPGATELEVTEPCVGLRDRKSTRLNSSHVSSS